jgi:hypothetical protein
MRGSRVLLIVGAILIVGALAVGAIFIIRGRSQPAKPAGTEEVTPTPTEVPQIQIVVAAQDIPRGIEITEQMTRGDAPAVILKDWPEGEVPDGAITRVEDVIGRTTRVDLIRELPILASMLVEEQAGSSAALQIPEGSVAYAVPVQRYSSVAWALQPGDYVDMIISLLLVDLDEEFQTIQPNQGNCLSPSEDPACVGMGGAMGRLEVMPNGWLVNLRPNESQRPRLVTQLTIQNALVLRVGDWPIEGEQPAFPTPEPTPVPEEGVGEGTFGRTSDAGRLAAGRDGVGLCPIDGSSRHVRAAQNGGRRARYDGICDPAVYVGSFQYRDAAKAAVWGRAPDHCAGNYQQGAGDGIPGAR